jgi:hypothetical protein
MSEPERPKEFEFSKRAIVLFVLAMIAAAVLTIEGTYLILKATVDGGRGCPTTSPSGRRHICCTRGSEIEEDRRCCYSSLQCIRFIAGPPRTSWNLMLDSHFAFNGLSSRSCSFSPRSRPAAPRCRPVRIGSTKSNTTAFASLFTAMAAASGY